MVEERNPRCHETFSLLAVMSAASVLRSQIAWIEGAITRQNFVLNDLHTQLQALRQQLHQTAQFPFHQLPAEIQSEIFLQCLPPAFAPVDLVPSFDRQKPTAPLLLVQICRDWRRVALFTPRLWRSLAVCIDPPVHATDVLNTWASRAGALPLDLVVWGCPQHIDRLPTPFVDAFRRNTSRIGGLTLETSPAVMKALEQHGPFQFSLLHTLELLFEDHEGHIRIFRDAPLLRSVRFNCVPPSEIELPWMQLTQLHVHDIPLHTCIEALRLALNLRRAILGIADGTFMNPRREAIPAVFEHAQLEYLEMHEFSSRADEGEPHSLSFLKLPALRTLQLGCDHSMSPEDLHGFLTRSSDSPPLQSLTLLTDSHTTGQNLTYWSSMHPFIGLGLKSLTIEDPSQAFTLAFFKDFGTNKILPKLDSLSISCGELDWRKPGLCDIIHNASAAFLRRVQHFAADAVPLRSFKLVSRGCDGFMPHFRDENSINAIQVFRGLQRKGVKVHIEIKKNSVMLAIRGKAGTSPSSQLPIARYDARIWSPLISDRRVGLSGCDAYTCSLQNSG
ncbi:F-box domain-containing protein [Mycena kentingensis (nom. inval.)]|nr:F-box domain-containing protein [Mycena kentingensis (nom. inval.)]